MNLNNSPSLGPLTEAEIDEALDRHFSPVRYSACQQGDTQCPTPDACLTTERQPLTRNERILLVLVYLASAGAVFALMFALIGWQ